MKVSIAQEKLDVKSLNHVFSHINLDILLNPTLIAFEISARLINFNFSFMDFLIRIKAYVILDKEGCPAG